MRHEVGLHRAAGQLALDVRLAPAQHHRRDAAAQLREVLVVDRPAALVELIEVAVEAEQRPDQLRIEELDDGIELVDAVLDRRAGQYEGVGRAQRLDPSRRLGLPVLDALRLVEHDDVRRENGVDVVGVGEHLLVVDDVEEDGLAVGGEALRARAEHRFRRALGEAGDLLLPLGLERGRADHQHARDVLALGQQLAGRDRLHGLAEAHLVGEQRALAEGQVQHALALIGQQRMTHEVETRPARLDLGYERGPRLFARAQTALPIEPWTEVTRDPDQSTQLRRGAVPSGEKRSDPIRIGVERSIGCEERRDPLARRLQACAGGCGPGDGRARRIAPVKKQLDARTARSSSSAKRLRVAPLQGESNAFDVLAGPEAVDPMVDAAAGVRQPVEAADLDVIRAAAPGPHAERAEDRLLGFERFDGDDFGAAAPAPQHDFLLVGGAPALGSRRPIEHGAGAPFPARRALVRNSRRGRFLPGSRMRFAEHEQG